MNREDIIKMAREAGFECSGKEISWESVICTEELERFFKLAYAAGAETEREACAKVCEDAAICDEADYYAKSIRARRAVELRGETK